MLANAIETRLYVNNQLQRSPGYNNSDNDMLLDLGSTFQAKRMVLGSCYIENYWCNLHDLSFICRGITYTVIPDVYLTRTTLLQFLNQLQGIPGDLQFSLNSTLPAYDQRLWITTTVAVALTGSSWYELLGFKLGLSSQQQIAESPATFAQTSVILIELVGLPNAISNSVNCTYQINNTPGVYGSTVVQSTMNFNSTNMVIFSATQQFSSLHLRLYDQNGRPLRTPNNNQSNINVVLSISCYDE